MRVDERVDLLRVADVARLERVAAAGRGSLRPHTTTVAPASASRSAIAAPMPRVPAGDEGAPARSGRTATAIGAKVYQTDGPMLGS